jgi:hypothetical protein
VALGGERARLLFVVIDGEFDGLDATVVAKVGLEASVAFNREVGGVAVLHDNKAGHTVAVETVGNGHCRSSRVTQPLILAGDSWAT